MADARPAMMALLLPPLLASQHAVADDPARAFFAAGEVLRAEITLAAADRQRLRDRPRDYVPARLLLDGRDHPGIGVKLKGAAGSFREVDDLPAFTVHLGRFGGEQRLHGLRRFHLNNAVQDDTRLCEWLGHELFAQAGLPAPRVAHALLWLDGRLLGLYVLREAYDGQFLRRAFGTTAGNLYDGGFCQDIDAELEKDAGDGPDDRADLRALAAACAGVDAARAEALAAIVDVPAFVDFLALEALLGHWDGYAGSHNNYRLWLPTGGRARFLPHGMDQLFGDVEASVLAHPAAIVASAVLQQPAFRQRYRERLRALLPSLAPARLEPRLRARAERLQRALRPLDGPAAAALRDAVRGLLERIAVRHRFLAAEVDAPEPRPVALAPGRPLPLKRWLPAAETDGLSLDKKSWQGVPALHARCDGRSAAARVGAFRARVLLGPGRYRLAATVRCDGIVGAADGDQPGGVRLAADDAGGEWLAGDHGWQPLQLEFEVTTFQRDVELRCELRARAGRAWFRLESLQLVRLAD